MGFNEDRTMKNIFLTSLLAAALALSGCDQVSNTDASAPKVQAQKLSRDAFTKLVMGKPDTVVMEKFGQPYLNNNYAGQFGILWTYKNITFDPASGKPDQFATVVFENGVVAKVVFK